MLPPSRSPSWWEIYVAAARALTNRFCEAFPALANAVDLDALLAPPLSTQQIADLIVSHFAGETFVDLLRVVDIADPNENHAWIASFAARQFLTGVITTNWDTLLERTAILGRTSFSVAAPGIRETGASAARPPLIKIHGSTVDARRLIETSSHKAREIAPELTTAWRPLCADSTLLVIGYSGADLNFGAAQAFFQDFVSSGGPIFWLHRADSKPALPSWIIDRVVLIEGALPDLLREIGGRTGATPIVTPVAGADAQRALATAMEAWSRELHIGQWSAATFLYALAHEAPESPASSKLEAALTELAREAAARLQPGSTFSAQDLPIAIFTGYAGVRAMERLALDDAKTMMSAAINMYETVHRELDGPDRRSAPERHMNLSSSWGNYAHALVLAGTVDQALTAFVRSLEHAYLGGNANSFLIALHNVLHYGFELHNVRRGMHIAEASIRLADRLGAVQSSIEFRVLLAFYHLDRNEVWLAAQALAEARRRAAALGDRQKLLTIAILDGHALLKRGQITDGLNTIAAAVAGAPNVALLSRPVEEARRYLQTIGVPQRGLFMIDLARERVAEFAAAIVGAVLQAKTESTIPWKGRHCSVSNSSAIDENDLGVLFEIGVHEFERDRMNAAKLGLMLAKNLLNRGYFDDAARAASNVLANPEANDAQHGEAHICLAHADAARGYLEHIDGHLDAALEPCNRAGHPPPPPLALVGLWYAVQCGDVAAATRWVKLFGKAIAGVEDRYRIATDVFYRLATFGPSISDVKDEFARVCEDAGIRLPAAPGTPPPVPHRYFDGGNADLGSRSVESANDVIEQALDALRAGKTDRARELVDSQTGELPDHQAAVLLAVQLRIVAQDIAPEALNRAMDTQRSRLVPQLAFASLARLEHTVASIAIEKQQLELAANILDARGFIAELAADPIARVQLSALATESGRLRGKRRDAGAHALWSEREAHYFGLPALAWAAPAEKGGEEQFIRTVTKLRAELSQSNDAVIRSARELRSKRLLTPYRLAVLRGELANRLLTEKEFDAAARLYRKAALGFHRSNNLDDELNAMAGEARVLSRSGYYTDAVARFEDAIKKAEKRRLLPNLLLGLAAAHLLEGSERRDPIDTTLVDAAIATYRRAIDLASLESMERALARLGLARALGEKNDQAAALEEFDRACAELAHLGSPNAKTLIENRRFFEQRDWHRLGLF